MTLQERNIAASVDWATNLIFAEPDAGGSAKAAAYIAGFDKPFALAVLARAMRELCPSPDVRRDLVAAVVAQAVAK